MTEHERQKYRALKKLTLFWIFFVILAASAGVLLILYALGYRYDLQKHKIVLVSVLYVDSQPEGADIYLNGRYLGQTKYVFPKIMPGTYRIKLAKNGFWPWETTIQVEPYSLIELTPALFYQKPKIQNTKKYDKVLKVARQGVIYQRQNEVFWLPFGQKEKKISETSSQIEFSPSGKYVAIEKSDKWAIFGPNTQEVDKRKQKQVAKWRITNQGEICFLNKRGELWLKNKNREELIKQQVKDFTLINDEIWFITKTGELFKKKFSPLKLASDFLEVADSKKAVEISSLSFCQKETQLPCLFGRDGFFILKNQKLTELGKNVVSLTSQGDKIAWLDQEGAIHLAEGKKVEFVTRYFEPPQKIIFFGPEYLLLQYKNKLKIFELETKQEFTVFKTKNRIAAAFPLNGTEISIVLPNQYLEAKITEAASLWQKVRQTFRK